MIYTELTKKALKLSFKAHKDQLDKGGMPYVYHPFHVAEQMMTEETVVVALLHDVVEDTELTLDDIRAQGFPESVVEALSLLTHDDAVPYLDYVAAVKKNPIARAVKLADLKHNSDCSRLDNIDEKTEKRIKKYQDAIALLKENPQNGRELAEDAFRRGFPEFRLLMETMKEGGGSNSEDAEKALSNIRKRKSGKEYSLSEHVDAMVFSLLSSQRDWKPIEQNADRIRSIFHNFDITWILAKTPEQLNALVDELKAIKCGNRQIKNQIQTLPDNIKTLQRIAEEHGSVDQYYNKTPAQELLQALSDGRSTYKLKQMGVPLVSEYLRNVGIDLVKPDVHVTRLLGRLGYTEHSPATFEEVFNVCDKIGKTYGIYNVQVDAILWGYCADGRLKKCIASPDCQNNGCKIFPCARCPQSTFKTQVS